MYVCQLCDSLIHRLDFDINLINRLDFDINLIM